MKRGIKTSSLKNWDSRVGNWAGLAEGVGGGRQQGTGGINMKSFPKARDQNTEASKWCRATSNTLLENNFSQGSSSVPCSATLLQQMWTNTDTHSHTFMQRVKGP